MSNEMMENGEGMKKNESLEDAWGAALSEQAPQPGVEQAPQPVAPGGANTKAAEPRKADAKPAFFGTLKEESAGAVGNLGMVLDIPVTISVEIGRTRMMIKELLQLGQGTVVELEKLAGEPMEIYVNGRLIARGEAVVINEKFGIKLTDIVSPSERINKLK